MSSLLHFSHKRDIVMSTPPMKRIWYQSFVDPKEQADYFECLRQTIAQWADSTTQVDVHGIVPPDLELNRLTELRCSAQVVANAIAAEQQGYDAFVIGHFQDGGLYEARAAVDIPVLALGESSMLMSCMVGRRIALVTIHPIFIPIHEEQIIRYGLQHRVVSVKAIETNPQNLVHAFTDPKAFQNIRTQFEAEVQPLVQAGVEVIIPAGGGLPALLFARIKDFKIGEAVVINSINIVVKMAEMSLRVKEQVGLNVSRAGAFVKPSDKAIKEFLESLNQIRGD